MLMMEEKEEEGEKQKNSPKAQLRFFTLGRKS
jgi:hypothetical protein